MTDQKTRPFLVSLGLGTESHHLVLQSRLALCGGELASGGAKWAGWSDDGEALLIGPLACQRCHEVLTRLDEDGFLSVVKRQVTLSRRMGIDVPPAELLGFKVSEVERDPQELTEDEVARALRVLGDVVGDWDQGPGEYFYVHTNWAGSTGVKCEDYFRSQAQDGGEWIKHWTKIKAESALQARERGHLLWLRSLDPSKINVPLSLVPGGYTDAAESRLNAEARLLKKDAALALLDAVSSLEDAQANLEEAAEQVKELGGAKAAREGLRRFLEREKESL